MRGKPIDPGVAAGDGGSGYRGPRCVLRSGVSYLVKGRRAYKLGRSGQATCWLGGRVGRDLVTLGRSRLAAAAIAVAVLAGVAATGVLAARAVVASEASFRDSPQSVATARLAVDPPPGVTAATSPAPTDAPTAAPTPKPTEPPVEISIRQAVTKPQATFVEPTAVAKDAGAADDEQGTVFVWRDGKSRRRVVLQTDLVLQKAANRMPGDVVIASVGDDSIVRREDRHGEDAGPVFRSATGGQLMALPGGVLLLLTPAWDEAQVTSFFEQNSIDVDRASSLGAIPNSFQIDTESGFPSLYLANRLAELEGVVIASPNWWREAEAK